MSTSMLWRSATALTFAVAAFSFGASEASAQDVSGTWLLSWETQRGATETTIMLTQEGTAITGTGTMRGNEVPVEGTVEDGEIQFTMTVGGGGGRGNFELTFDGMVEGDEMEGTMSFGGGRGGRGGRRGGGGDPITFTAKRQG